MWYVHEGCFSTRCKGNASMMCCAMGSLVSEVTKVLIQNPELGLSENVILKDRAKSKIEQKMEH